MIRQIWKRRSNWVLLTTNYVHKSLHLHAPVTIYFSVKQCWQADLQIRLKRMQLYLNINDDHVPIVKYRPKCASCLHFIGFACSLCTLLAGAAKFYHFFFSLSHDGLFGVYDQISANFFHFHFFSLILFCVPPIKVVLLWADMRSNSGPLLLHRSFAFSLGFLRVCFANSFASLTHTEPIQRERAVRGQTRKERNPW